MITGVYSLLSLALFFFLPQSVIAQAYPKQAINLIIPSRQATPQTSPAAPSAKDYLSS